MVPRELEIGGVYLPPTLVVGLMALTAAWVTAHLLNRIRLTRYVANPPLVFLSITALYFTAFGTFLVRV